MITPSNPLHHADHVACAMRQECDGHRPPGWGLRTLSACPPAVFDSSLHSPRDALLSLACFFGLSDCADHLLRLGADPAASRGASELADEPPLATPLMRAAASGSAACVELLGAKLQTLGLLAHALAATDPEGSTAFHFAASGGHAGAMRALLALDSQSPLNERSAWTPNRRGDTPAILAAGARSRACLEALASLPRSWLHANCEGMDALSTAIAMRDLDCCEFFAALIAPFAFSEEALNRAAARHTLHNERGALPHALLQAASLGESAIFAALAPASLASLPALSGADERETLLNACQRAAPRPCRVIELCLRAHRQWRQTPKLPKTALARAYQDTLREALADAGPFPSNENPPLFFAAERLRSNEPDALRECLLGAATGPGRQTSFHWAASNAHPLACGLFVPAAYTLGPSDATVAVDLVDREGQSPLALAAGAGSLEACQALLSIGACAKHDDFLGQSPLMRAILAGSPPCAYALELADPDARSRRSADGFSPAMAAASIARPDLLAWVLERADPSQENLPDARGDTLAHHICRHAGADEARLACLRLALDLPGANPNALNLQGLSPLDLAAARGWAQGVEALAPLHEPSLHLSSPSPLARAIDNATADAGAMALLLARWIDPRAKEPYRLSAPMNACARANFLKQPQLAQALVGLAELWTLGEPPGRQDPALLLAPKNLAQAVAHFRSKIHQASHRLGADSSRSLPPRQTPP